jgi:acyl-CoA reductase-like NAD-dependent aldehyde dehydrogenase
MVEEREPGRRAIGAAARGRLGHAPQYRRIVADVRALPLAGGRFRSGDTVTVHSPYNGAVIGEVPACTTEDVGRAVAMARAAHEAGPLPLWKRAAILDAAARALAARSEEFARTIAAEAAKPIKTARVEADRAVGTFQFAAAEARKLTGEMVALDASAPGEGKIGFTLRVPVGVVGAIAPFNFPLNLVAHKLAPAIAAGCPVVLKPASQTPFSAIALVELLLDECGLPAEQLHVVTGGGGTVGNALVDHPDVALITFTGSPDVGWGIRARAPRKRVGLELGNNAPAIIEADGDWQAAADKIKVAGFSHAGQSCISTQRIYVQRPIASDFTDALVERVRTLVVGDPLDDATDVSALISTGERERVQSWIDEAVAGGAKVAAGGELSGDGVLLPTVLTGVTPEMKVCAKEVFGPVVAVAEYDELDEALALANATDYGLQAAIFTRDVGKALTAVRRLDYGGVLVNEVPTWRADQQPYGGVRDSGNTREGPAYALKEMTEIRMIVLGA